jgi:solute carrier family 25 phosphate transporter 23/24/25/41
LYRGLKPTLIGVGPNLALNFAAYETLRNHLQGLDHGVHPMAVDLASGSAAAVVSATATFPIDLVRRRMQMRDAVKGDSFLGVFKRVLAKEGVTGLYRGILPEFAKVAPGVAITYTSYAFLKRLAGVDTGRL